MRLQEKSAEAASVGIETIPGLAFAAAASVMRVVLRDATRFLFITVASMGIAWLLATAQTPRYEATALAAVAPRTEAMPAYDALKGVQVLDRPTVVMTIAALASTATMRAQAGAKSGDAVAAAVLPDTSLIRIQVRSADATRSATVADSIARLLSAQMLGMYRYYDVKLISPAVRPKSPYIPRPARALAAGLLIGLFLGVLAAHAAQRHRTRIGSATE